MKTTQAARNNPGRPFFACAGKRRAIGCWENFRRRGANPFAADRIINVLFAANPCASRVAAPRTIVGWSHEEGARRAEWLQAGVWRAPLNSWRARFAAALAQGAGSALLPRLGLPAPGIAFSSLGDLRWLENAQIFLDLSGDAC